MTDLIPLPNKIGQKTSAESMPVVLPSDYNVTLDKTGLATDTKQDTIIGHIDGLETLVTNTNTKLDKLAAGLVKVAFDFISANYTGSTTDVWTYKTGGSGGTTVATVTITYEDATKTRISTVGVV